MPEGESDGRLPAEASLKALAYFGDGDLPSLSKETRDALERAVRDTPVDAIHPRSPRGGIAP